MKKIQFISVQELKENSIIQYNVDEKILNLCISEFQELELSQIVGKDLYKRLSNVLVSGATISGFTYTEDDTLLFEYIKPVMVYGSLLYSLSPLHYKVSNKGVQKITESNTQIGDKSDIEALRSNYSTKLEGYKKLLLEYMATDNDPDTIVPTNSDTSMNFTGVNIPDNQFDEADYYRSQAYRTGYYRRQIY